LSAPPAVPRRVRRNPDDITPGRLTRNMLTFGRELRDAGLPIGSGQLISFVDAISEIDVRIRQDFYSAAKVTLVTSPEQIPVFDAIFGQFWRRIMNPVGPVETSFEDLITDEEPPDDSTPRDASDAEKKAGQDNATRVRERSVLSVEDTGEEGDGEAEDLDDVPDDVIVFSAREVLRKKDFSSSRRKRLLRPGA
jgi:uncharacterized protein with von Willebrand factor type A (vWA) domain